MTKKETAKFVVQIIVSIVGDPDGTGCCVLYHLVGSKYESYYIDCCSLFGSKARPAVIGRSDRFMAP